MPIHIKAEKEQLSPLVIAPGDPDRSKYIAENYLEEVKCYNEYRQLLGYTGKYKGIPVSVQTTGMGVPSCMIVCEELVMFGATHIIPYRQKKHEPVEAYNFTSFLTPPNRLNQKLGKIQAVFILCLAPNKSSLLPSGWR